MPPKKRKSRKVGGGPLLKRAGRYYWNKWHERLPGGHVFKSLRTGDQEIAEVYAGHLRTLMDRGDWSVIERWVRDELPISDLARMVREGEWSQLKRLHSSGLLLGEQRKDYLERVLATRRRRTHRVRESALRLAVAHFGEQTPMHAVTKAAAEAYLHASRPDPRLKGEQEAKPWSPNTQRSHRVTLAAFWQWAMEREHEEAEKQKAAPSLLSNPWRKAEIKKRGLPRFSFFTPEQARALLHHRSVVGKPVAALLATAFYAGLRAAELAHLRTDVDVNLDRGFIQVQAREGAHPWEPKTDNSHRKVRIIPALLPYLRHHRPRFAGRYFFHALGRDQPPSGTTLQRWVEEALTEAGFKYGRSEDALSLHSCRHSFVTWLVADAVPLPTVAKLAGDTVQMILSTYAHHLPDKEDVAYALLDKAAKGPEVEG